MELEQHLETTVKAHDQMLHRRVDLLLRTGKVLVESLADTNRIMRNMKRTAAYLGIPEEKLHINISFTMLMVNVSDENFSFTKFQRINGHGVNMSAISEISKLSWRAIENDYTLDQYEEELEKIRAKKRNYTPLQTAVGAGFACGGFCVQFGCDWMAFLYASIAAIIGMRLRQKCNESGLNGYMGIAISAFVATMVAWATTFLPASWTDTPWHPLLACALFIVPGVPLINFVDARQLHPGRYCAGGEYDDYDGSHGVWHCFCREIMRHRELFPYYQHDSSSFLLGICACRRYLGNGFLDDIQHPASFVMGGSDRRYLGGMYS